MMLAFDATPLIYLAKAQAEDVLADLSGEVVVPSAVHRAVVVQGEERGHPDTARLRRLVQEGPLDVVEAPSTPLSKRLESNDRLHGAERAVLVLADHEDGRAILDETYGRRIAQAEGIDHGGTLWVLIRLVKNGEISAGRAREIVDEIADEGWYCSTALYARIVDTLDGLG